MNLTNALTIKAIRVWGKTALFWSKINYFSLYIHDISSSFIKYKASVSFKLQFARLQILHRNALPIVVCHFSRNEKVKERYRSCFAVFTQKLVHSNKNYYYHGKKKQKQKQTSLCVFWLYLALQRRNNVWMLMLSGIASSTQREHLLIVYSQQLLSFALLGTHSCSVNGMETVTVLLPFTQLLREQSPAREGLFFCLAWLAIFPSQKNKAFPHHV